MGVSERNNGLFPGLGEALSLARLAWVRSKSSSFFFQPDA